MGIKPTVGRFSTTGVVQACRALDCVSVFARCVEDGAEVARLMQVSRHPQHMLRVTVMHMAMMGTEMLQKHTQG